MHAPRMTNIHCKIVNTVIAMLLRLHKSEKWKIGYGPVTQLGKYLNGTQEVARLIRVRSTN